MSNDEWARQRKDNHVSPGVPSKPRNRSLFSEVPLQIPIPFPTIPFSLLSYPFFGRFESVLIAVVLRCHIYHLFR